MFVDKETGEPLRDARRGQAHRRSHRRGGRRRLVHPARAATFSGHHDPERYEKIEDILDVWFDSGSTHAFTLEGRADSSLAGRPLFRGLRPASRLVPVVPAGSLRHARAGAVPRHHDPRHDPRREGGEDVQIDRQQRRAAGHHPPKRCRDPAAVGRPGRLCRGPAHRAHGAADDRRRLSQAAQHGALSAGRSRWVRPYVERVAA